MFSKSFVSFVLLAVLSAGAQARMRIIERDGRALYGRRFGQESPAVVGQIGSACRGEVCGVLGGKAVGTLLAASPECAQQDLADDIIDAARNEDAATAAKMIQLAKTFRQAEKNTPPDFTTNPPTNRNSVFCQTPPRNAELVGLNQAQDPNNDPDVFFDPTTKSSVKKGSQANTSPLGGGATSGGSTEGASSSAVASASATSSAANATETPTATTSDAAAATTSAASNNDAATTCPAVPTVTVTVDAAATATATDVATTTDSAATETATTSAAAETSAAATTATESAAAPAETGAVPAGVDLGSCTDPTIKFGVGIEGRKETSFIPNNIQEFAHGSAQNSGIITQFICDTFVNSCKANQAAVDLCKSAQTAAAAAGAKQGAAADTFNAKFGVTTNFAAIQAIDSQGKPVA